MRSFSSSLGFRLTVTTYVVATVFLFVTGFAVYRISQDSIQVGAMEMVREMADNLQRELAMQRSVEELGDSIFLLKVKQTGSAWIMDSEGYMLHNPDPLFREEYVTKRKKFGNVMVSLQFASPRPPGTGVFKEKLIDVVKKYEEGFGTYSQFGEKRILAFRSIPSRGYLIGVDEPVTSANSELDRIKKYIFYTALVSAILIMVFNYLAIRIIIRPYYHEVEDLNVSLQKSNRQLEDINVKLTASNRNLTTLHEIGLAMQQSLTLKDILDMIISGAHDVLGIDRINLMLPSVDGSFLECRAAIGNEDEPLEKIRVPLGSRGGGALASAFESKEIVRSEEGIKIPHSLRLSEPYNRIKFLRSRAFVAVPLVVKDHAVGVIGLDNKPSRRAIVEAQVNLMSIFANQAAVAVENARLYDQLREKIEELDVKVDQLSILHQIGNSMQRVISRSEALGFIMRGIREGMGFEEVVLFLYDRSEDLLFGEMALGLPEEDIRNIRVPLTEEDNILVMSAAGKRPVSIVHSAREELVDILSAPLRKDEYRESLNVHVSGGRIAVTAVPLVAKEEVVGVVAVSRREPPMIKRGELELLMLYSNTAGLTVERAELYSQMHHELKSMEITDHVSSLFTLSYGRQRFEEELAKCREKKSPLSLIIMGVDNLKSYNERWGHDAGDNALGRIGEIIKAEMRTGDYACRYGGRILAAILPATDLAAAVDVAERVQSRMRKNRFPGPAGGEDHILSLSMGVMEKRAEDEGVSFSDLFKPLLALLQRAEAEGGGHILVG